MWQNIVIAVIVLLCAVYVGRKFCKQARGQAGCGGGCCGSGCTPSPDCSSRKPDESSGNDSGERR
jgi:hypothetical protein